MQLVNTNTSKKNHLWLNLLRKSALVEELKAQKLMTYSTLICALPFFLHNDIISYQNVFEILQQASCGKYALHKGWQQLKILVVFTTKAGPPPAKALVLRNFFFLR